MSEEMKKELETEVKTEGSVETMEDYAAELEASYAVLDQRRDLQIGRASCRERVCQYV